MKKNNFYHSAPPWISNLLAAVITLIITISQIGPLLTDLFDILDCQQCIQIIQKVLSVIAVILAILKIIKRRKPKDDLSFKGMDDYLYPPPPKK